MILVTGKGRILSANRAFIKTFCTGDESPGGRSLLEYSDSKPEKLLKFLKNCSRSRQINIGTLTFPDRNDQSRTYRCEGALLEPADEMNSARVFLRLKPKELTDIRFRLLTEKVEKLNREIRERRRAEERNKLLYVKAKEANRMKDEFLATISHELRTPLNSILGWIKILRSGQLDAELAHKALETIERNSQVQAQLIEDILDVSRIITGKLTLQLRPVDLTEVIEAAIDSVRPMAENKRITLVTDLEPAAIYRSGDAERLQQIVWNLLSNAVKFTPEGGRVAVGLERTNSHVEIKVSDTGEGISDEFLPFVFERFLQADSGKTRKHSGLGLGLAIVRHLVELHGGTVDVFSDGRGKGAVFTVRLPEFAEIAPSPPEAEETTGRPASSDTAPAGGGEPDNRRPFPADLHLLVVDDEPDVRDLLKIILENHGSRVVTASSAAEAFDKLADNNFDLLISDIAMPEEDGYSLIKRIRQRSRQTGGDIPAVAMTAHARAEDRQLALSSGFDVYIAKPFAPEDLIRVIEGLIPDGQKSS